MFANRQAKLRVVETLERRAKQFRSRENSWPFRMPHEPLDLDTIVEEALGDEASSFAADALRTRTVLHMEWSSGSLWELWAIALPSGLHIYCDTDGRETRVLASARRGNPADADGFFLERLAESRGELFGIEMHGAPPDRIRSSIGDRDFLADVFVELFEGATAESEFRLPGRRSLGEGGKADATEKKETDFRRDVAAWLDDVLSAPPKARRQPRVREQLDAE